MSRAMFVAVGAVVLGAGWIAWQQWATQNPVNLPPVPVPAHERSAACDEGPTSYHLDGGTGLPQSWQSAVSAVDAVLVARLRAEKPDVIEAGHCIWNTAYPLTVEEVIKGNLRAGETVRVEWPGRPIDTVRDYPKPRAGEDYLLFLTAERSTYRLTYGADATMRLVDGKLRAIAERQSEERDAKEFLANLRAFVR